MEDINMEPSPLPLEASYDSDHYHQYSSPPSDPTRSISSQSRLPEGQCQAILVGRGVGAGHRCPCNHFTLNPSSPATVCDCGHLSCYHTMTYNTFESTEFRKLQDQIRLLDEQLKNQRQLPLGNVMARINALEEQVEKNHEDLDQRLKESNGRIGCVWQQVDTLEKRGKEMLHTVPVHTHQIRNLERKVDAFHSELTEADIALQERVERLEISEGPTVSSTRAPSLKPVARSQTPRTMQVTQQQPQYQQVDIHRRNAMIQQPQFLRQQNIQALDMNAARPHIQPASNYLLSVNSGDARPTSTILAATEAPRRNDSSNPPRQTLRPLSIKFPATSSLSESWTVHISLLPNRSLPFPFEKDTRAYKRCLSRGLHRYVVVQDHSAEAFHRAVTGAFGALLHGRPWMPLQAKLCDVQDLQGLPMLRQLDKSLQHKHYDLVFLRTHCAVLCPGGKLDSLYIAMQHDDFSWNFLYNCPVFMDGLDSCWETDPYLDKEAGQVGDLGIGVPLKKRSASEMSLVSSGASMVSSSIAAPSGPGPSSVSDGNSSRPKIPRTAPTLSNVAEVPRAVETI